MFGGLSLSPSVVVSDADYGRRFLAALRQELRSTPTMSYATIVALESADRDGMVAILSDFGRQTAEDDVAGNALGLAPLSLRESLVALARTAEPHELARAFATELRRLHTQKVSRDALAWYGLGFLGDLLDGFLGE